jgi:hypothetical protein
LVLKSLAWTLDLESIKLFPRCFWLIWLYFRPLRLFVRASLQLYFEFFLVFMIYVRINVCLVMRVQIFHWLNSILSNFWHHFEFLRTVFTFQIWISYNSLVSGISLDMVMEVFWQNYSSSNWFLLCSYRSTWKLFQRLTLI